MTDPSPITTHPIQYNAPLFELLAKRGKLDVKVFYTWGSDVLESKYDPGFQREVAWDIPLLEGYDYTFVNNVAKQRGSHHFFGIDNPTLCSEISAWDADAVLVFGWSFKSHLKAIRFFYKKKKLLFRGDSTFVAAQPWFKSLIRQQFLKFVYRHVDICLYVGTNNRNYYKRCRVVDTKLLFAPHAVDNDRFYDCDGNYQLKADKWKAELGIEPEAVTLLFAGKLTKDKNAQLLIDTLPLLSTLPVPHPAGLRRSSHRCHAAHGRAARAGPPTPVFLLRSMEPGMGRPRPASCRRSNSQDEQVVSSRSAID